MPRRDLLNQIVLLFFAATAAMSQTQVHTSQHKFPLTKFDNFGCRFKGRSQDCAGKLMQQILDQGKASIPIFITQLTDIGHTKEPIEDYWSETSSGDVAYIVLTDLFTDSDWKTFNMPGVPDWTGISSGCHNDAESCWREYLKKNGRKSIQDAWLQAWNKYKDRIYWEPSARCFRLSKN